MFFHEKDTNYGVVKCGACQIDRLATSMHLICRASITRTVMMLIEQHYQYQIAEESHKGGSEAGYQLWCEMDFRSSPA